MGVGVHISKTSESAPAAHSPQLRAKGSDDTCTCPGPVCGGGCQKCSTDAAPASQTGYGPSCGPCAVCRARPHHDSPPSPLKCKANPQKTQPRRAGVHTQRYAACAPVALLRSATVASGLPVRMAYPGSISRHGPGLNYGQCGGGLTYFLSEIISFDGTSCSF